MDIKRCAYAQHNRSLQAPAVPVHPLLLLGRTEANPDDIRGGPIDSRHQIFFLHFRKGLERRRGCS